MTNRWTCFTSFNRRLYDIIAAEMLASWLHHWPSDAKMIIYLEDEIKLPDDPRLEIRDWKQCCGQDFEHINQNSQHLMPQWSSTHTQRYAKKGLSWIHMMHHSQGRLCWLDADSFTIKPFVLSNLDRAIQDHCVACFDVSRPVDEQRMCVTAESGFVLIDTDHKDFHKFRDAYSRYYLEPCMPEQGWTYWDGEICMHAARQVDYVNLRTQCHKKKSTPIHGHWLGEWFRHIKTKRKKHYPLSAYRDLWLNGRDLSPDDVKLAYRQDGNNES
jgi:hypothetical protein